VDSGIIRGGVMGIEKGKKISFEYTLTVDGEVVDTSEGQQPLEYTHGDDSILPGLTSRMEGMEVGEERKIEVPAEEGYGMVNPEAFQETPKEQLPPDVEPKVGTILQAQRQDGSAFPVKITEVKESTVVIDCNHPLAGKTLTFDIKIVSIA
jgi:FKBP-type peptidyl-prolyl cis-trans isomerase 2